MTRRLDYYLDQPPPFELDSELSVIGALLASEQAADNVLPILRPEHFYDDANRKIYTTLSKMIVDENTNSATVLSSRLKESGQYEAVGGSAYLYRLMKDTDMWYHAKYHATIVIELARRRMMIHTATVMLADAFDRTVDIDLLLSKCESNIYGIRDDNREETLFCVSDFIQDVVAEIDCRTRQEIEYGIPTGFPKLDNIIGGFCDGHLIIVAARPSVGKSALALNSSRAIAEGKIVFFASLEMSRHELAERLIADIGDLDGRRLKTGDLNGQYHRVTEASQRIAELGLYIDDRPTQHVADIAAGVRKAGRRAGRKVDLIVIDYLQLIEPDDKRGMNREQQVSSITRSLKTLARTLEVPIVCLSQLNRKADGAEPRLSDLRESGAIEQDADEVIFIHRDGKAIDKAKLIVAKQRNGPQGFVDVDWLKHYCRFEECELENYVSDFDDWNNR